MALLFYLSFDAIIFSQISHVNSTPFFSFLVIIRNELCFDTFFFLNHKIFSHSINLSMEILFSNIQFRESVLWRTKSNEKLQESVVKYGKRICKIFIIVHSTSRIYSCIFLSVHIQLALVSIWFGRKHIETVLRTVDSLKNA